MFAGRQSVIELAQRPKFNPYGAGKQRMSAVAGMSDPYQDPDNGQMGAATSRKSRVSMGAGERARSVGGAGEDDASGRDRAASERKLTMWKPAGRVPSSYCKLCRYLVGTTQYSTVAGTCASVRM